jgi:PEP-CTERM motif
MIVTFLRLAVAAALCAATAAKADSFLEIINGTERRSAFVSTTGPAQFQDFVIGRLRYVVDAIPGQATYMTFTVLGSSAPGSASMPSFLPPLGAAVSSDGRSFSLALSGSGMADFGFLRTDSARVSNQNNASWQDMNFGIVLDPGRLSGHLLLEDALLGSDFDYNDLTIRFQMRVAPVPEPSTYALMLAGLGVVGWAARRRRSGHQPAVRS